MVRFMVIAAMAAILTPGGPSASPPSPTSTSGAWLVDTRHSDVQLISDATTDYGKTKINYTVGYARINGEVKLDSADPANSKFELHIYPADAMAPPIGEMGKMQNKWLEETATHTLICFHSKQVSKAQDGKLQVTGDLVLTRVDRNVQIEPTEAYSGPTYGPPIIHRIVREATFVLDAPVAAAKDAALTTSGRANVAREGFPQLVKAVLSTNWPPVVQDAKCQNTSGGAEDYRGMSCSGNFMQPSGMPPAPTSASEDYPGASDFNRIVGNQLSIVLHLHLTPPTAERAAM